MLCMWFLGSAVWVRSRWISNPLWTLCIRLFLSKFFLYFGWFVVGSHCWEIVIPGCTLSVAASVGMYVWYYFADLISTPSIPVSRLYLDLYWVQPRPLVFMLFALFSVQWIHLFCLMLNPFFMIYCLFFPVNFVKIDSLFLVGCASRETMFHPSYISLFPRHCVFFLELFHSMFSMLMCTLILPAQGAHIFLHCPIVHQVWDLAVIHQWITSFPFTQQNTSLREKLHVLAQTQYPCLTRVVLLL